MVLRKIYFSRIHKPNQEITTKQITTMAVKNGIGYSPLTDRVYLGKQNQSKGIWTGAKTDITNQFIDVAFAYFEENTIRTIDVSNGNQNIIINVKNDKAGIEKILKHLNKRLADLT